jgi:uncharacterized protein (TIGR00251 family)
MSPFTLVDGGVRVAVRVTPKASRDKVDGLADTAEGATVLKVAVTAPPEDGKANDAVVRLLAKTWKIPKTSLDVVSGATSRSKIVLATSSHPQDLMEFLMDWVTGMDRAKGQ